MKKRVLLCMMMISFAMILSACSKTQTDDKGTETGSQSQQQILVEIAEDSDDQYSKWAEAKEKHRLEMEYAYDGRPQYQEALRNGYADPQTPKLTYQDVKDIIAWRSISYRIRRTRCLYRNGNRKSHTCHSALC